MQRLTTNENETRIILHPETLNMREGFRNSLNRRITHNVSELPYVDDIDRIPTTIDSNLIIELNNTTSSERRIELMENIVNQENINENAYYLIANSSNQLRTYLHNLLITAASDMTIFEEDLYRIGNIFLYTIANLNVEELFIRDIVQYLRENIKFKV